MVPMNRWRHADSGTEVSKDMSDPSWRNTTGLRRCGSGIRTIFRAETKNPFQIIYPTKNVPFPKIMYLPGEGYNLLRFGARPWLIGGINCICYDIHRGTNNATITPPSRSCLGQLRATTQNIFGFWIALNAYCRFGKSTVGTLDTGGGTPFGRSNEDLYAGK